MKYLICNLKAHKTYDEIIKYKNDLANINTTNVKLILAPSNISLSLFKDLNYSLCTQNIDLYESLNLTGDTTIKQLKSLNVEYAIIGHYERKKYYQENEHTIISKIKNALENNLKVIYCIGETYEEMAMKVHYKVLERSIARVLNNISPNDFKNIIIAYEPTYMIGNEAKYDFKRIKENIDFIKNLIDNYYHEQVKVVYGGNINSKNINEFQSVSSLDGFIIGSSSLDINNLTSIINTLNN